MFSIAMKYFFSTTSSLLKMFKSTMEDNATHSDLININVFCNVSCKEYYNFNAFFAILMGLSDVAVSRLSTTWDKLPSKSRKQFTEYEALIDPSRNHRAYRITVGKLPSPMIPFMPLLIKGD